MHRLRERVMRRRNRRVSEAKRALSVSAFQQYGYELRAANTREEVDAVCERYEQRKRELGIG